MELEKLSKFLCELRRERHITQKELGNYLGVSDKTISKWETGIAIPDSFYLLSLSKFFGISIDNLLHCNKNINPKGNETAKKGILIILIYLQQIVNLILSFLGIHTILKISILIGLALSIIELIFVLIKKEKKTSIQFVFVIFSGIFIVNYILSLILIIV